MFLDSPFLLHSPIVILLMLEQSQSICCRCLRKVCCNLDVLRSVGCEHASYDFTVHKFEIDAVCLWTFECCIIMLRVKDFCIASGDITSSEGVIAISKTRDGNANAGFVQRAVAPRIFCAAATGTNMTHFLSGRVALCSPRLHLEFPVQLQLVPLWRKSGLHEKC